MSRRIYALTLGTVSGFGEDRGRAPGQFLRRERTRRCGNHPKIPVSSNRRQLGRSESFADCRFSQPVTLPPTWSDGEPMSASFGQQTTKKNKSMKKPKVKERKHE